MIVPVDDHPIWIYDHPKNYHPNRGIIFPIAMTLMNDRPNFPNGEKITPPTAAAGPLGLAL